MKQALLTLTLMLTLAPAAHASLVELSPRAEAARTQGEYPLLARIEPLLEKLAQLRQLPVRKAIAIDVMERPELAQLLLDHIQTELKPDDIQAEKALYVRWGMLPADFDYVAFMVGLYSEQIGGFYDPRTRRLHLMKGLQTSSTEAEMLIAHELTHALQDQHFGLRRYLEPGREPNSDRTLAQMALIEGDATLASGEYISGLMQRPQQLFGLVGSVFRALQVSFSAEKLRQAPPFIRESMLFPYEQGLRFVQYCRQQQGWSWQELARVYQQPPTSSEQILHPEAYFNNDTPRPLPAFKPASGYRPLGQGVSGELGWRQYFQHHLGATQARTAARGWGNDRYQVWLDSAGQSHLSFDTRWDTPAEAREFSQAYLLSLKLRYPTLQATHPLPGIQLLRTAPGDYTLIQLRGDSCRILDGWPAFSNSELQRLKRLP